MSNQDKRKHALFDIWGAFVNNRAATNGLNKTTIWVVLRNKTADLSNLFASVTEVVFFRLGGKRQ